VGLKEPEYCCQWLVAKKPRLRKVEEQLGRLTDLQMLKGQSPDPKPTEVEHQCREEG
jgi:hypothetical protein